MSGKPRIPCSAAAQPAPSAHKRTSAELVNPAVDPPLDKSALRRELLSARASIGAAQKTAWDAAIGARVLAWWDEQAAAGRATLGVYWPLRGEPDLAATYAALAARGVRLALPVVIERDAALAFAAWTPGEALLRDAMGVAVPAERRLVARPEALLIPCLGYNGERFRLGYGGGYYDRTLAALPRPATAGVAYRCLQADFASAPHDIALDRVLTEV